MSLGTKTIHLSGHTLEWRTLAELLGEAEGVHTLEQPGVNNLLRVGPRHEREGVCFSRIGEQEGVGGLAVQRHTPVLFRT